MGVFRKASSAFSLRALLFLSVAAAAVVAQGSLQDAVSSLPSCAVGCFETAIANSTCATTLTPDCICSNPSLNAVASTCVKSACTVKDILTNKKITSTLCEVPIDRDDDIVPIFAVFLSLALVAVGLRILARILTKAYFWWDDLCNFFGMAGCVIFTALNIKSYYHGLGTDIWLVPFDDITSVMQMFFADMLLYTATRFFIRASIILFYLRVFPPGADNKLGRILVITLVVNFLYNLSFFLVVIFQCKPIHGFWMQWEGHDQSECVNVNAMAWAAAATGIAFDVWLLALPFPQLLTLNLQRKKKIMGSFMFGVGACVIIISLIRFKTINEFTRAQNPTKDIVQVCIWSGIEIDVGVICPCLPSFRLLLRRLLPSVMGTMTKDKYEMDRVSGGGSGGSLSAHMHSRSVTQKSYHDITEASVGGTQFRHENHEEGSRNSGLCGSITELVESEQESTRRHGR
ncbi:hypothetical protein B0H63DRAFT_86237 [Podospora didyma]|uniref:CFEM domain-containing protein n=1 Tax=Podospora didyma TaxID=330526 RepID=A0AAE0K0J3_9PEZI|nr:hypothetical protein B0H63DRAFT_86237 [Podospora didyma]